MRRGVEFEAGGQVQLLRFNAIALCRIEAVYKEKFFVAVRRLQPEEGKEADGMSFTDVLEFWKAALRGDKTRDEAAELLDEVGTMRALHMIGEAIELAFPDVVAAGREAAGKKAKGTAA